MNYPIRLAFLCLFYASSSILADGKLLSLADLDRNLIFADTTSQEFFLCLMENKKVFGKNRAQSTECYSTNDQALEITLEAFATQIGDTELQAGFFTSEGKQVFPTWEENGQNLILLSFVLNTKSQLFVQTMVKETKKYFYLRTIKGNWKAEK